LNITAIFKPGVTKSRLAPFREGVEANWFNELTPDLDAALILGGDGTVHRYLKQLHEWQIPFLHVPIGSGNDFASSLGIKNPKSALGAWNRFIAHRDNIRSIDLGTIHQPPSTTHLFCNVAYFGIDSDVTRRANLLSPFWRANGGYILSLFPALLHYKAPKVTLTADNNKFEKHVFLAVAANGTRYGRGLRIAPRADMSDGLLDLCLVRDLPRLKVATLFPSAYFGQHLRVSEVEYHRFQKLRVVADPPLDVYGDGEPVCQTPIEIGVIARGLRVIVPPVQSC
jgi:diacylglycerol kinase (ATP)